MHPQLDAIARELEDATRRIEALASRASSEQLDRKPSDGGWSATDCIEHLNKTSKAVLPMIDEALAKAPSGGRLPARMRRDPIGWMIWKSVGPNARMKASTSPPFEPARGQTGEVAISEFRELQSALLDRLRLADGKPLHRIRIPSPFSERLRYSLFSAFSILAAHEHRHLGQAERALESTGV